MTKEELLRPRVKVIAPYPKMPYKLGAILEIDEQHSNKYFDDYPHLFRRLEWWEERDASDMPEYVKQKNNDFFTKVDKYFYDCFRSGDDKYWIRYYLPATEEEYLQYIKSKS